MNVSFTPSNSNNFLNCLTSAFFGSFSILIIASIFKSFNVATTGNLPTNSGISPNFKGLGAHITDNISNFSTVWATNVSSKTYTLGFSS